MSGYLTALLPTGGSRKIRVRSQPLRTPKVGGFSLLLGRNGSSALRVVFADIMSGGGHLITIRAESPTPCWLFDTTPVGEWGSLLQPGEGEV